MSKTIYLIDLNRHDCGELWLDENRKPIKWLSCTDAMWCSGHDFIFKLLDATLVELDIKLTDDDWDLLNDCDCLEKVWKVIGQKL